MDGKKLWMDWAVELQSLAQAGLFYGRDKYDRERYRRIREIAAEIAAHQSDMPLEKVKEVFCCESGYQTPKLDTRAAIIRDGRILLVREENGLWSLPGGWADVDISLGENVVKEAREEAGVEVRPTLVVAIQDRERHNRPPSLQKVCKVFVLCDLLGGEFRENLETTGSGWFAPDELPEMDCGRNTPEQVRLCFEASRADHWRTILE